MTDLDVRCFEAGDGPAVRDLHERAMRSAGDFAEDVPDPDLQDVHGHHLDGDGEGEFLVGELNDMIVAMVAYHPVSEWILADQFSFDDDTAELTRMRIDPNQQRHGFGERIYTELERRAREAGYDQLVLDVSEHNESARSFYENQGFEYLETASLTAMDRTFRLAVYRKRLDQPTSDQWDIERSHVGDTDLHIRPFQPSDSDAIVAVHEAAFRGAAIEFDPDAVVDEELQNVTETYADEESTLLVGTVDGEAVAFGGYRSQGEDVAELSHLRVHPNHQRQGFARQLTAALETRAREAGIDRFVLETHEDLPAAQGCTNRWGTRKPGGLPTR